MYYASGNYDAFLHPRIPKDINKKSAYIVGSGLAGLATAVYLLRDGHMNPKKIHILESLNIPGGSCDGQKNLHGFIMRGGREMDNHFECMWDLYKDIPSFEDPNMTVLDYYYYLNKDDPNYSNCRATINRGQNAQTGHDFTLDKHAQKELLKLYLTQEELLQDKKISDFFTDHFWKSNFWLYWQTMFAFQRWSSALEMKRYLQRYVHHINGLPDFSALRFTRYNQYESMILPLVNHLKAQGVEIEYGHDVKNIKFDIQKNKKVATEIIYQSNNKTKTIKLTENDLVFITNGSCTDSTCYGDQNTAPDTSKLVNGQGDSWDMWRTIAKQCDEFGNPMSFCNDIAATNWMSATIETSNDEIISYIEKICERNPRTGKVVTGGIVTVRDSEDNWFLSWTINRQPQFKCQNKKDVLIWLYGLNSDKPGNFVKKPMKECTGKEIAMEWLYHIGVPEYQIEEFASKHCNTTTAYMPYINAFFQPRKITDRPKVVPDKAINFAFIGQFAETPRDTIFTTEYSIRTGMEAVYTLLDIERGVPEVWGSTYDIRDLLKAVYYALDRKKLSEADIPLAEKMGLKLLLKKIEGTDIEKLLKEYKLI